MNIRRYISTILLLFGCIISLSAEVMTNVRCVVRQDGAVVESTDYYPYGTPFTTANSVQLYKYGTKELDRMHGLDLYDSEARWYDSLLGRTSTMDPKAEKYYSLSPYTWCVGNPVRFVDSDGKEVKDYVIGAFSSIVDNFTGGATNLCRSLAEQSNNIDDFYSGVQIGNGASAVIGASEIIIGCTMLVEGNATAYASAAAVVPSGGMTVILVAGGSAILAEGAIITSHGSVMLASSIKNYGKTSLKSKSVDSANSSNSKYTNDEAEHKKNARNSTKEKYQNGQTRKYKDKGNEKGDARRKRYK